VFFYFTSKLIHIFVVGDKRHDHAATSKNSSASTDTTSIMLGDAKERLNERGERLSELEEKFGKLSDSSASFLKNIKEYNEAQSKKKWWEL
jgi:hypothetical protein